jgi:hypothetical protein
LSKAFQTQAMKNVITNVLLIFKERKRNWFQCHVNQRKPTSKISSQPIYKSDMDLCTLCSQQKESTEHLLSECELVQVFKTEKCMIAFFWCCTYRIQRIFFLAVLTL